MKEADKEFIEALKANEAYSHLDIDTEIGRMKGWLLTHPGRVLTQRFIVNWLNRRDKPVEVNIFDIPVFLRKLGDYYKREITQEQARIWQEQVKYIKTEDLFKAVEEVIKNEKTFPTPSIVASYASKAREGRVRGRVDGKDGSTACIFCSGRGLITALKDKYSYVYRCSLCQNWEGKLASYLPKWDDSLTDQGFEVVK